MGVARNVTWVLLIVEPRDEVGVLQVAIVVLGGAMTVGDLDAAHVDNGRSHKVGRVARRSYSKMARMAVFGGRQNER